MQGREKAEKKGTDIRETGHYHTEEEGSYRGGGGDSSRIEGRMFVRPTADDDSGTGKENAKPGY